MAEKRDIRKFAPTYESLVALYEAIQSVGPTLDLEEVLNQVIQAAVGLLDAEWGFIVWESNKKSAIACAVLSPDDIDDRKVCIRDPKSGKESELVFIPQKVAHRLKEYIRGMGIKDDEPIFPITYSGARAVVKKTGNMVGINLSPHDLRRHAATYASRSGTPIEIVSKVILRHANLSTTQRYLGKVSDLEALRWIENLHG